MNKPEKIVAWSSAGAVVLSILCLRLVYPTAVADRWPWARIPFITTLATLVVVFLLGKSKLKTWQATIIHGLIIAPNVFWLQYPGHHTLRLTTDPYLPICVVVIGIVQTLAFCLILSQLRARPPAPIKPVEKPQDVSQAPTRSLHG